MKSEADLPQINADERRYARSDQTERIIGVFYEVYNELGYGFVESVYETAMYKALCEKSLKVQCQVPIPVWFRGEKIGSFCADMIVEDAVILEMKAAQALDAAHISQLLNYLRATHIEIGLLLNFGKRPNIRRGLCEWKEKDQRSSAAN